MIHSVLLSAKQTMRGFKELIFMIDLLIQWQSSSIAWRLQRLLVLGSHDGEILPCTYSIA